MEPKSPTEESGNDHNRPVIGESERLVHSVLRRHDGRTGNHDRREEEEEHCISADPVDLREGERRHRRGDNADHDGNDGIEQVVPDRSPIGEAGRISHRETAREEELVVVEQPFFPPADLKGISRRRPPYHAGNRAHTDVGRGGAEGRRNHPPEGIEHQESAENEHDIGENIADELCAFFAGAVRLGRESEERKHCADCIAEGGVLRRFHGSIDLNVFHVFHSHSLLSHPFSYPARTGRGS